MFYYQGVLILSNACSLSIEMVMALTFLLYCIMWYISDWFSDVGPTLQYWHSVIVYDPFYMPLYLMCPFFFQEVFHPHSKGTMIYSFLVMSISDFGTSILMASKEELWHHLSSFFWKRLRKISINSSLSVGRIHQKSQLGVGFPLWVAYFIIILILDIRGQMWF